MLQAYPTRATPLAGYVVLGGADAWGLGDVDGCGCGGSCGCSGLGAMTAEQAAEQIFPAARVRGGAGHNQAARDLIREAAQSGVILTSTGHPGYIPGTGDCDQSGVGAGLKLVQQGSGLALTGMSIGLTTAGVVTSAALAPFTMGISALIGLFPLLFSHHAQAVRKERSVLCTAVPAASNYLAIIDQAVRERKVPPQQAIDALNSLQSDFESKISGIRKGDSPTSSGECNAACLMASELRAIVAYRASQYQDLAKSAPMTSGSGPTSGVVTSGSTLTLPQGGSAAAASQNWFGIAALLVAGFIAFKVL